MELPEQQIDTAAGRPERPGQPDRAELERLAALFAGEGNNRAAEERRLPPLKLVQRSVLKHMDLRRICFFRYGTEAPRKDQPPLLSYQKIARKLYLPVATVFTALKRYWRDGLRFVDRRRLNFQKTWERQRKLKGAVKDYLLSYEVLSDWAPLNLDQRVKKLAQLGVKVAPLTLSQFYRRNKVTYRVVKYEFSRARKRPKEEI
jgi:hypothetical protein